MSKKILKMTSNFFTIVLLLLLLFMVFLVISTKASGGEPQILGYQLKTVLSGSMEPTFKTGSIIAVEPVENKEGLAEGDVVTYLIDEQNVTTHRIIEVVEKGENVMYRTKGDNNENADGNLLLPDNIVAKYTGFTVPYIGHFIEFAKSKAGTATLLIGPGLLLLIYSAVSIMGALKDIEKVANRRKEEEVEKSA